MIVNWNTKDLLHQCLTSLRDLSGGLDHEVIVVDNASGDGSQEMVRTEFPEVRLVENSMNVGFPRANNQVLPYCRGGYVLFLNSDAAATPGAIEEMMAFLDGNIEYGAVGPMVTRPDGSIQPECACNFPTLPKMFFELTRLSRIFPHSHLFGSWRMTYWDHMDSRDVECLLGAAILMRRKILDDIGLLDEHMYIEDDDLCYRIIKAGWKIRYLSTAVIIHHDGESRKRSPKFYHHYQIAWYGLWFFFRKHKGVLQAGVFRLMSLVCSMVGVLLFYPLSLLASSSLRAKGKKSRAILLWSLTPARYFKSRY